MSEIILFKNDIPTIPSTSFVRAYMNDFIITTLTAVNLSVEMKI